MADERPPADEARTKPDGQLRPKWWPKEGDETPGMDPRSPAHNPSSPPPHTQQVSQTMMDASRNVRFEAKGGEHTSISPGVVVRVTPEQRAVLAAVGMPNLTIEVHGVRWRYEPRQDITALEVAQLTPMLMAGMSDARHLRHFDRLSPTLMRHFVREG